MSWETSVLYTSKKIYYEIDYRTGLYLEVQIPIRLIKDPLLIGDVATVDEFIFAFSG